MSDLDRVLAAASGPVPPPPMSAQLDAQLADLRATGMRRPLRQIAILVGISLLFAGVVAYLALRPDAGELPMGWLFGAAVGWLLGFVIPCYLATVPRAGSMAPRWKLAAAASIVASVGFVTLGLGIHPSGPSSVQLGWDHLASGRGCMEAGLAAALVPVVIGAIFLRGSLPVGSRWIAAALGAGGGCLGGLVLHLHCHVTDGPHVGLMHGGVVVIAALLAAAIVPVGIKTR